jgi:hypothetical protein
MPVTQIAKILLTGSASPSLVRLVQEAAKWPCLHCKWRHSLHNQAFQAYCLDVMHCDVPTMLHCFHAASATQVVSAIGALADEQRKTREGAEVCCHTNATKRPHDIIGSKTETLMCLCQVSCESDLPEYCKMLANSKQGDCRRCLEATLEKSAELLGYDIMFRVSPALAQKVNKRHWHSHAMSKLRLELTSSP